MGDPSVGVVHLEGQPLPLVTDRATELVGIVGQEIAAGMCGEGLGRIGHARIVDAGVAGDAAIDAPQIGDHILYDLDVEATGQ